MRIRATSITCAIAALIFSCGRTPTGAGDTASLRLRVRIPGPASMAKTTATTWDSLIVSVRASDLPAKRYAFAIGLYGGIVEKKIASLPAGDGRIVEAWTVDRAGDTIHGVKRDTVDFEPREEAVVSFILDPIRGSIYIALSDIPAAVDSIVAGLFALHGRQYTVKVKKATRTFITIDKIPYGTEGVLLIAGLSAAGDTVASWRNANFVFTSSNMTIEADFVSIGGLALRVTVHQPAVTVVRGVMDTTKAVGNEEGPLVISELMFTATVSSQPMEYIEFYNPTAAPVTIDTMFIDISGTRKTLVNVTAPAKGFYVIGSNAIARDSVAWAEIDTTISLDLVSTTGIITAMRKDSTVIDWVAYENDLNTMGWPALSSSAKKAIVLDSLSTDPEINNYGVNWSAATTAFSCGGVTFYGTPGKAGR